MSTLSALKPRPFIFANAKVTIELVMAYPEDLKELHDYDSNGNKIMKLRIGMVYWLKNMLKNQIEPTPRMLTADADQLQIKEWLSYDMIFIARNSFS